MPKEITGSVKFNEPNIKLRRDLTVDDVIVTSDDPEDTLPSMRKMRTRHHRIAEAMAQGIKGVEIARTFGLHPETIYRMKHDPTFRQLVSHYEQEAVDVWFDNLDAMKSLTSDALLELHERLIESPESITNSQLLEIVKTSADRSGTGPSSTQNVNVNVLSDDALIRIKDAVKEIQHGETKTIEGYTSSRQIENKPAIEAQVLGTETPQAVPSQD